MKKSFKITEWLIITLGCALFAAGIAIFLNPLDIAAGGASGIAIIINGVTGFPTGTMILLINIPLFIAGFFVIGRDFFIKTLYATTLYSILVDLFAKIFPPITDDRFLGCVGGGVLAALGMGLVFRNGGSTGGTDIVTKLLRRRFRNVKTGKIFLCIDSIIIGSSAFFLKDLNVALYAAISLYITTKLIDVILYGTDEAKLVLIISNHHELIAGKLLSEVDVGVTYADGAGAYTNQEKKIIICAVKKHQFHMVKDLVKDTDPAAFMIVSSASEIFGEGYKKHGSEEL